MIAHLPVELRDAQTAGEDVAIYIGKGVEFARQALLPPGLGRVEHVEELAEHQSHIAAVGARVGVDQLEENNIRLKDASVVGEQAKEARAEERRVGKECVGTCRSRGAACQ